MAALCVGASIFFSCQRRALAVIVTRAFSIHSHSSINFLRNQTCLHSQNLANRHLHLHRFIFVAPQRRSFSVEAADPGSINSPLISSMENKIKEQLKAVEVVVTDIDGGGRHVSIDVISSVFEGQSEINRQRMVYKAIWEELQNVVHAVDQMRTRTPAEAEQERST